MRSILLIGLFVLYHSLLVTHHSRALAQQHYARWQYTDLGTHHLPIGWDIHSSQADFNGLVAGWIENIPGEFFGRPYLFDVNTGDLIPLADDSQQILDLHGTQILADEFLYDHATGKTTVLTGPMSGPEAMNEAGQVAIADYRDVPFGQQRFLTIYPTGEEILPPWEDEVAPGVFVPAAGASLHAIDFAGNWIGGSYATGQPGEGGGFVANIATSELQFFPPDLNGNTPRRVNELGHALLFDKGTTLVWDGTSLTPVARVRPDVPQTNGALESTGPGVLTNSGQFIQALKVQDDGTILAFAPGPIVQVEDPCCPPTDYQTAKLVIGEPLLIAGDYNASGSVEQGDLDEVLLAWGESTRPSTWVHDFPHGRIDQAELDTVLLRWGRQDGVPVEEVTGHSPLVSGVPEPGAVVLALVVAITAYCTRSLAHLSRALSSNGL